MKDKNKNLAAEEKQLTETPAENTKKSKKKASDVKPSSFSIMKWIIAVVIVVVFVYLGFTAEVREGNCAVILRFGAVRSEITEAGLYFKLPWPFETVVTYDSRAQYLESNNLETTTKDKRNVIFQTYVVWQIKNPVQYHNSVGAQGTIDSYIKDQLFSATNSVLGLYEMSGLVSTDVENIKIDEIQEEIHKRVHETCEKNYGIDVLDVSILRLSLPETNLNSVFTQMTTEREKEINEIQAAATKEAALIRNQADQDAAAIKAEGVEQAAAIRSETEKAVADIYAQAQAANYDLYRFITQLDTIVSSVKAGTVLVYKTDEYPFNVLSKYADYIDGIEGETIITDLQYVLSELSDEDREALIDALYKTIKESAEASGINTDALDNNYVSPDLDIDYTEWDVENGYQSSGYSGYQSGSSSSSGTGSDTDDAADTVDDVDSDTDSSDSQLFYNEDVDSNPADRK